MHLVGDALREGPWNRMLFSQAMSRARLVSMHDPGRFDDCAFGFGEVFTSGLGANRQHAEGVPALLQQWLHMHG
jgi:hypothetical protein